MDFIGPHLTTHYASMGIATRLEPMAHLRTLESMWLDRWEMVSVVRLPEAHYIWYYFKRVVI